MKNGPIHPQIMNVVDILLSEPGQIGVDEIGDDISDLGVHDEQEIKRLAFVAIREMLRRGAQVDFHSGTPAGRDHPDNKKSPDEIVDRIDREWKELGHRPSIYGEICVFVWTLKAMEAYERRKT